MISSKTTERKTIKKITGVLCERQFQVANAPFTYVRRTTKLLASHTWGTTKFSLNWLFN